jgi:MYXO-CTERM domain-containing protein
MNSFKPVLLAFSMALACGQLHAAAFTNGSFETGATGDQLNTVPDGWTGKVEYFTAAGYGLVAADGAKLVDLAWYGDVVSTGNLSQSFNTVVGQTYKIDFQLGGSNYAGRGAASTVHVGAVGDYAGASFAIAANPNVAINWTAHSITFTASGTTSTLAFSNTNNANLTFAFLDGVSVNAVPEASGVTMALAALALLGGVAAKRRRG